MTLNRLAVLIDNLRFLANIPQAIISPLLDNTKHFVSPANNELVEFEVDHTQTQINIQV